MKTLMEQVKYNIKATLYDFPRVESAQCCHCRRNTNVREKRQKYNDNFSEKKRIEHMKIIIIITSCDGKKLNKEHTYMYMRVVLWHYFNLYIDKM